MARESLAQLEKLIDRLLAERSALRERNAALTTERDRLLDDRRRVDAELDKLLVKLNTLEGAES